MNPFGSTRSYGHQPAGDAVAVFAHSASAAICPVGDIESREAEPVPSSTEDQLSGHVAIDGKFARLSCNAEGKRPELHGGAGEPR